MKRRLLAISMAALMVAGVFAGCGSSDNSADGGNAQTTTEGEEAVDVSIGTCIYKFDDTFMTGVRNNMEAKAKELGAEISIMDSQNKQPTQNEQVDGFITKGVTALAVNPVDRTAAGPIVEKAKAEESGTMSGEIIAEYWNAHPEADKNGDGVLQYIMITGEPGHQDATLRTEYSVKAITDAGIKVEEIANDTAKWDKVQATDLTKALISSKGIDSIEAIICNNDDMALGAIEALKAEGYNTGDATKYIPVVGVDATAPALEAMANGSLLGTVLNDGENQGIATTNIAVAASQGKEISKDTIGYDVTDGKYVWIPYVKVTADNYQDFQ